MAKPAKLKANTPLPWKLNEKDKVLGRKVKEMRAEQQARAEREGQGILPPNGMQRAARYSLTAGGKRAEHGEWTGDGGEPAVAGPAPDHTLVIKSKKAFLRNNM